MNPVRYQPIGPLFAGEGSRAVLGLAFKEGTPPHPVAMVWAPPELTQDPDQAARLVQETKRATVFEHPNILRVHGLVLLAGGLVRVTEYADGELLRRVLEGGRKLPPAFAALVVADAAMGVHYAHLAGNDDGTPLVHGDLRPETLMVSFSGVCKVTGYGALGVAPKEPHGRRVLNRRRYSAPEQLLGGRDAMNVQTDVFLLGLVLYECLTGKMPFKDTPDPDKATLSRPLPPLPLDVPRALDAVLRKATEKRAKERYPTALAFRDAVVEAMGELPSRESFAEYLAGLFPPDGEVRRARRQVIETALAEAQRRPSGVTPAVAEALQRSGMTPVPDATPEAQLKLVSPAEAPESAPARAPEPAAPGVEEPPAPSAPAPSSATAGALESKASHEPTKTEPPRAPPEEDAPARPGRSRLLLPLVGVVACLVAVALVILRDRPKAPEPEAPEPPAPAVAVEPAKAEPDPAPQPPAPDAGAATSARSAAQGAVAAAGALLEFHVEPQVEVTLEGRSLGRTPLAVTLPPGRHVLYLNNPELGIHTARAVTVSATERNLHEVRLLKGFIHVRAPRGTAIIVDGRHVGTAPIEQIALYEGPHRLLATLNGESWEQTFQLEAHQHVTFTVNFESP